MIDHNIKENLNKIKKLLVGSDYKKIDSGIELAVSLNEPKIFASLLNECNIDFTIEGGSEHMGSGGGLRPVLNHWLKKKVIDNGNKLEKTTGYYIFLSLILNMPKGTLVHESLEPKNIKKLSLKNCSLEKLPSNMSKLSELKILDISFNSDLKETQSDLNNIPKLEIVIDHGTPLEHNFKLNDKIKYPSEEEVECNGCYEAQSTIEGMVCRYDGYFCNGCDQDYNDLWMYCYCCGQLVDPTINDYNIDFETRIAEYDSLFDEEYDCKEEYRKKALIINDEIKFKFICSYCEQDSRPSDLEITNIIDSIKENRINSSIITNIEDEYEQDENGLSDKQIEIISNYLSNK